MKRVFYGPMPGLSLVHEVWVAGAQGPGTVLWDTPCPLYGMDQILELEKVHIFMNITKRENFFRTFFQLIYLGCSNQINQSSSSNF